MAYKKDGISYPDSIYEILSNKVLAKAFIVYFRKDKAKYGKLAFFLNKPTAKNVYSSFLSPDSKFPIQVKGGLKNLVDSLIRSKGPSAPEWTSVIDGMTSQLETEIMNDWLPDFYERCQEFIEIHGDALDKKNGRKAPELDDLPKATLAEGESRGKGRAKRFDPNTGRPIKSKGDAPPPIKVSSEQRDSDDARGLSAKTREREAKVRGRRFNPDTEQPKKGNQARDSMDSRSSGPEKKNEHDLVEYDFNIKIKPSSLEKCGLFTNPKDKKILETVAYLVDALTSDNERAGKGFLKVLQKLDPNSVALKDVKYGNTLYKLFAKNGVIPKEFL